MIALDESQIDIVLQEIDKHGVSSDALRYEILDHACCSIEQQMNEGKLFIEALNSAMSSFGDHGLPKIERQIKSHNQKKAILRKLRLSTAAIAACLVLMVIAVDAQERPEIKPLDNDNFRISSSFGQRMDPFDKEKKFHFGVDLVAPKGTPVKATADGIIEEVKTGEGYGKLIRIRHDEEYTTLYSQLDEFKVEVGQKVKKGDVIALSGNSGRSTAPHLHYEVIRSGKRVNPELYFSE